MEISSVFVRSMKKGLIAKPPFARGGGTEPQETQKRPNPSIFIVFSCLAQNHKKGLATGTQEAKLGFSWHPRSPKDAQNLHFYGVFLFSRAKNTHFYMVLGLWERNQAPKEKEKTAFYFHFYKVLCISGERVKGARVQGFWGKRVLGTRGLGLRAFIKRGECCSE